MLLDHWLHPLRARTECRPGPHPERLFAGHRGPCPEVYVVTRNRVEPLRHRGFNDGTPFDWGVRDAGAVELAFALLHDVGRRPEPDDVLALAANVIGDLPRDGFVLSANDVRRWRVRRRRSYADHRLPAVGGQAWISAQWMWMFPFIWTGHERVDR